MIPIGSPQFLFMAEEEGCDNIVSTRRAKLNAIIGDIRKVLYKVHRSLSLDEVLELAKQHGISTLDSADIDYIQSALEKN